MASNQKANELMREYIQKVKTQLTGKNWPILKPYNYETNTGEIIKLNNDDPDYLDYSNLIIDLSQKIFATLKNWNELCKFWRYFFTNHLHIPTYGDFFYSTVSDNPDLDAKIVQELVMLNSFGIISTDSQVGKQELEYITLWDFEKQQKKEDKQWYTLAQRAYLEAYGPMDLIKNLAEELNTIEGICAYWFYSMGTEVCQEEIVDEMCTFGSFGVTYEDVNDEKPTLLLNKFTGNRHSRMPGNAMDFNKVLYWPKSEALLKDLKDKNICSLHIVDTIHGRNNLGKFVIELLKKYGKRI